MPKLVGKRRKVFQGENNPRHFIMIPIGTGNQYCRNCHHIGSQAHDDARYCRIFTDQGNERIPVILKENPRLGPERCQQCIAAEKLVYETKQTAKKEGEDSAFFKSQEEEPWKKGKGHSMAVYPESR